MTLRGRKRGWLRRKAFSSPRRLEGEAARREEKILVGSAFGALPPSERGEPVFRCKSPLFELRGPHVLLRCHVRPPAFDFVDLCLERFAATLQLTDVDLPHRT